MPILKLKSAELQKGEFYLAYSAKSKKLTRHGNGGVIVEYIGETKKGRHTFKIPMANGKFFEMAISNLDTRKDAFVVELTKKNLEQMKFNIGDEGAFFPKYGPKTRERAEKGVEVTFNSLMKPDERYPEDKRDGTATLVFSVAGGERPVYLNNYQAKVVTDVLQLVCSADEIEAKRIAEEKARIEKLKEGGVRLAVGKMELGQKCLPNLLKLRKEFTKKSDGQRARNCSYTTLYGDAETGEIHTQFDYINAPCHASICSINGELRKVIKKKGSTRLYILTNVMKTFDKGSYTQHNTEAIKAWVNFLVNDSVYADLFVDKDVNTIIKYGYVVNCDAPSNVVASALMATRCIYEYGMRGLAFHKLRQHLPANLAYYVSQFASGDCDDKGQMTSLNFGYTGSGHSPMCQASMTEDAVIHLALGATNPKYWNASMADVHGGDYKDYASPNSVHSLFGKLSGYGDDNECVLVNKLKNLVIPKADKKAKANAFDIPKTDVDSAIEAAVKVAKKWADDYGIY